MISDTNRLLYIIENVFMNMLRSLPNGSTATFQITQTDIPNKPDTAMYECTLLTHGDSESQDIQSSLCSPIPKNDPLHCLEEEFILNQADVRPGTSKKNEEKRLEEEKRKKKEEENCCKIY